MTDKVSIAQLMRETMKFLDRVERKQRVGMFREFVGEDGKKYLRLPERPKYERAAK